MKKHISCTLLFFLSTLIHAESGSTSTFHSGILQKIGTRLSQIWHEGTLDLYLTGYAWHNRLTYTRETMQKNHYNELAWGGGLGRGLYDEDGDWHGLYAVAFSDSHKNLQPNVGYSFLKIKHLGSKARIGAGFTALVTARADMFHGYPFPGAAPLLSLEYGRYSLVASYVPGKTNIGNVLFLYAKIVL